MSNTICTGPPDAILTALEICKGIALDDDPPPRLKEDEATWKTLLVRLEGLKNARDVADKITVGGMTAWSKLLCRACEKKREDWNAFERMWRGGLCRKAREILPESHQAEDAVQEGLMKAFAAADTVKVPNTLPGFVMKCVARAALDFRKSSSARLARDTSLNNRETVRLSQGERADARSPCDPSIAADDREALRRAIADLPECDRDLLVMRYDDSLTYEEIAKRTNRTVNQVTYSLSNIHEHLQKKLTSHFDQD